jgi:hypothetical protein
MNKDNIQQRIDNYNKYIQDNDYVVLLNEGDHRVMLVADLEVDGDKIVTPCYYYNAYNSLELFDKIQIFKLDKAVVEADAKWARVGKALVGIDVSEANKSLDIEIKAIMNLQGIFNGET